MSSDGIRRVRDEIVTVLKEFGVNYTDGHSKNHPTIMFDVGGKHLNYTYAGGDPRAHLNARSDIRRMLIQAGAKLPEQAMRAELNNSTAYQEPPLSVAVKADKPKTESAPLTFVADKPEVGSNTLIFNVRPPTDSAPQESAPEPEVGKSPEPVHLNPDDNYLIYQARQLAPNKCLVIELDKDLLIEKGHVVIIPLDKPSLIPMSKEMFEAMFTVMVSTQPVPEQSSLTPPPPPPFEPDDTYDEPVEGTEQVASPIEDDNRLWQDPPVLQVPEGISGLKPPRVSKPLIEKAVRAKNIIYTPYRDHSPRTIEGVPPQLGRILAAMMHVSDTRHRTDLEPSHLEGVLAPHDRKQVAARVKRAVELGLVERGLPLPSPAIHGWHIKITAAGRKMVRKLKSWPWLYDGQPLPTWAIQ